MMYLPQSPTYLDHDTAVAYLLQLTDRTDASGDELAAMEEYAQGVNGLERAIEQIATILNGSQIDLRSMLVELDQKGINWRHNKAEYPFMPAAHLDEDLAVAYLFRSTGRADVGGDERDAAVAFVQEVNGLEAACERAAAYLRTTQTDFRSFLTIFRQRRIDLQREYPDEKLRVLIAAISLSIDAVGQASADAVDLLCNVSWARLSHIPEELAPFSGFRNDHGSDSAPEKREAALEREHQLGLLADHALIHRNFDRRMFEVNFLVNADLQNRIMESERQVSIFLIILKTAHLFSPRDADSDVQERLLPLALYCVELIATGSFNTYVSAMLIHDTAYYLYRQKQYAAGAPLFQQSLTLFAELLEAGHPITNALSDGLSRLGDLPSNNDAAKRYCEITETLYQRALGFPEESNGSQ